MRTQPDVMAGEWVESMVLLNPESTQPHQVSMTQDFPEEGFHAREMRWSEASL